jgi:hypothetical protein
LQPAEAPVEFATMIRDQEYFRRRAAEARASACVKDAGEDVEMSGQLALAYRALARTRRAPAEMVEVEPGAEPMMLRD